MALGSGSLAIGVSEGEVALRSHALMGAVRREIAVPERVDAGFDCLAAAVGAAFGKRSTPSSVP